jgi:hypothetical protein
MRHVPRHTIFLLLLPALGAAEQAAAPAPPSIRASRNTYSAVLDVLAPSRTRLTDEQIARLKRVPIEAVWGAVQAKGYRHCFLNDFRLTQPGTKLVGRALTMRYLPVRPDLMQAVQEWCSTTKVRLDGPRGWSAGDAGSGRRSARRSPGAGRHSRS